MRDIQSNIPKPSPGVGGYCLTKDPYILSSSKSCPETLKKSWKVLGRLMTQINYVINHFNVF